MQIKHWVGIIFLLSLGVAWGEVLDTPYENAWVKIDHLPSNATVRIYAL